MQDFNYDFSNAMEVTVEVSCCKYSKRERLLIEWENNMKSLISFVEQAQYGVRGFVKDDKGIPRKDAKIRVRKINQSEWRTKNISTDKLGRYWRILRPGKYVIQAEWNDKISPEMEIDVPVNDYVRRDLVIRDRG